MYQLACRMSGLSCVLILFSITINGQTVKLHVSSKAGDRLSAKPDAQFSEVKATPGVTFENDDSVKLQRMDGFGASVMEVQLITLNTLPAEKQEEVLRALFDPKEGAGYTAMKTPIAGTDFQSKDTAFSQHILVVQGTLPPTNGTVSRTRAE